MDKPIVFFDGVCGLCNRAVDFLLRWDKKEKLLFAPLQGVTAEKHLGNDPARINLDSVVVFSDDKIYKYSDAAFRLCYHLGGPFQLLRPFKLVPRFIRDGIYRWIARNRYGWFGKSETCRLPTPAERRRFLD